MIPASELRKGIVIELNGRLYRITNTQYSNPGRGAASMRAQLMDIQTEQTQFRVFSAEDSINNIYVQTEQVKYLYRESDTLVFMNGETYDQYEVSTTLFGDDVLYLREEMDLALMISEDDKVLDYELPKSEIYTVVEAEAAAVGNTAGSVNKRVKVDTGLSVTVPGFINAGDTIKVDTRDGSYLGRA